MGILLESGEMYLETILVLKKQNATVRAIDISSKIGYSKPSVSRAIHLLLDSGYISISRDGNIDFTTAGEAIATKIYERHQLLTSLLTDIGVSQEIAEEDACKIEHDISDETFEALKKHYLELLN